MGALNDIAFLARSANRVRVLETLARESHDRAGLQAATGVPRATVGRIVTQFETRGWIERRGREYTVTPLGAFLAAEFDSLLGGVETMRQLRRVIDRLPTEGFDFDLGRFADAEIIFAQPSDAIAPARRMFELFATDGRVRLLTRAFVRESLETLWNAVVNSTQRLEAVVTAEVMAAMRSDPETERWIEALARSERATIFRHDGTVPYDIALVDGGAVFAVSEPEGTLRAVLETDDERVVSWVESTLDDYRNDATVFDPDTLTS